MERLIDQYWAGFVGCDVEQLLCDNQIHTTLVPEEIGFWALSRRGGWVIGMPPSFDEQLRVDVAAAFRPKTLADGPWLQRLMRKQQPQDFYGPAVILLHKHPTRQFASQPYVREVTPQDRSAVDEFHATTPAVPWTLDESTVWVKIFGAFVDGHLVAASSVRIWGNLLAEVYVDTSPMYQRQGYGKAVTSAALNWIHTETSYCPESVVELSNYGSLQLMKHLGFEPYSYMVYSLFS